MALGLLDIRLICGDPDLVAAVQHDAIDDWRGNSRERLPELRRSLADRHLRAGDLAYLLEPDLKEPESTIKKLEPALKELESTRKKHEPVLKELEYTREKLEPE